MRLLGFLFALLLLDSDAVLAHPADRETSPYAHHTSSLPRTRRKQVRMIEEIEGKKPRPPKNRTPNKPWEMGPAARAANVTRKRLVKEAYNRLLGGSGENGKPTYQETNARYKRLFEHANDEVFDRLLSIDPNVQRSAITLLADIQSEKREASKVNAVLQRRLKQEALNSHRLHHHIPLPMREMERQMKDSAIEEISEEGPQISRDPDSNLNSSSNSEKSQSYSSEATSEAGTSHQPVHEDRISRSFAEWTGLGHSTPFSSSPSPPYQSHASRPSAFNLEHLLDANIEDLPSSPRFSVYDLPAHYESYHDFLLPEVSSLHTGGHLPPCAVSEIHDRSRPNIRLPVQFQQHRESISSHEARATNYMRGRCINVDPSLFSPGPLRRPPVVQGSISDTRAVSSYMHHKPSSPEMPSVSASIYHSIPDSPSLDFNELEDQTHMSAPHL